MVVFTEMVVITEIRFAHERGALAGTFEALPGTDITVIRDTSTDPEGSVYHVRFDDGQFERIRAALEADPTVDRFESMSVLEDECLCSVVFATDTELLAPAVTSAGGFVLDARSPGTETHRRWYERCVLPDRESLHDVWQHAREGDFDFEIVELHSGDEIDTEYPRADALTDEQERALVVAYEQGYFAEPRETSLEDLAGILDISASAVGGRLKRGMKALVGTTLVVNRPEE